MPLDRLNKGQKDRAPERSLEIPANMGPTLYYAAFGAPCCYGSYYLPSGIYRSGHPLILIYNYSPNALIVKLVPATSIYQMKLFRSEEGQVVATTCTITTR